MPQAVLPLELRVELMRAPEQRRALEAQCPALESTVRALAELAADGILRHRDVLQEKMVEALLQGVQLSPLDQRRARMTAEAMRDIFAATEWLSAEQVGEHNAVGDMAAHGRSATPERLTPRSAGPAPPASTAGSTKARSSRSCATAATGMHATSSTPWCARCR